jgi:RNA:NAD 2'-phosphotransferase (TPT1/KptA family)
VSGDVTGDSRFLAFVLRHAPQAVILRVDAAGLRAAGQEFFLAANGVWLTGPVPPRFLSGLGG